MTEEQEREEYLKMCREKFSEGDLYSVDESGSFEEDPEQVALDHFNYDGYDGQKSTVYQGTKYIPTNTDEIDLMIGENWICLVDDVKPYAVYEYDEANDSVIEVEAFYE